MPEYLAPGVYVEEIDAGAKPIEGVSTSTAGFIGETERGPTEPKLIVGFESFRRLYGGSIDNSYLPDAVEGFYGNGGKRCFVCRVVSKSSKTASLILKSKGEGPAAKDSLKISAIGPGQWGNNIAVKIDDVAGPSKEPNPFKMIVMYWKEAPKTPIEDPTDPTKSGKQPDLIEVYDNLTPNSSSSDFYETRINGRSSMVTVKKLKNDLPTAKGLVPLATGDDGSKIALVDYKGDPSAPPGKRTGLTAFKEVDEISLLCAPNENDIVGLNSALVQQCEILKDRFAILQADQSADSPGKLTPPLDSKYASFNYPWIKIVDPVSGSEKVIPPGGHIAGIYARSDAERGVHKAPANEIIRGALKIQFPVTTGDQDMLNPRGVNCIRSFPGRGIRLWGARTTSSDPAWKYINIRRLFIFLEESIEESTQWVVFEPNDQKLWARVKQSITDFLTRVWKDGALMGVTPEEAFFVKCDETTMTPDDIDNGRLIILIGVAPVKAAEFVIFRISQWRGGASVSE